MKIKDLFISKGTFQVHDGWNLTANGLFTEEGNLLEPSLVHLRWSRSIGLPVVFQKMGLASKSLSAQMNFWRIDERTELIKALVGLHTPSPISLEIQKLLCHIKCTPISCSLRHISIPFWNVYTVKNTFHEETNANNLNYIHD
ncbi:hypothetical protein ACJX0J_020716 [Zea mays]